MSKITYKVIEGAEAREKQKLLAIAKQIFFDFDDAYIVRVSDVVDPLLCEARNGSDLIGFKIGYRRGRVLFYSWLGGVHPDWRHLGIAKALAELQHTRLKELNYEAVETRISDADMDWNWNYAFSDGDRVQVVRVFKAQNAFGAELKHRYICYFDAGIGRVTELSVEGPFGSKRFSYSHANVPLLRRRSPRARRLRPFLRHAS